MSEMLSCPFCGSRADMRYDGIFWAWCPECDSEGTPCDHEHEAIAAWNRRSPAGAPGSTDAERAAWLADKIVALGDYAKEAASMLRRWPSVSGENAPGDGGMNG